MSSFCVTKSLKRHSQLTTTPLVIYINDRDVPNYNMTKTKQSVTAADTLTEFFEKEIFMDNLSTTLT